MVKALLLAALVGGILNGFIILKNKENDLKIYNLTESISQDGFDVTVNKFDFQSFKEPNSGMLLNYAVVDLSIKNTGSKPLSFIPVFQTHIRTASGYNFDMSPLPGINPIYAGDISPGAVVSGELSYYIPETDQELYFFFDPGWNLQPAIFVEL